MVTHSIINEHQCCFQFLAIMKLLGYKVPIFQILSNCFPSDCTNLWSLQQSVTVVVSPVFFKRVFSIWFSTFCLLGKSIQCVRVIYTIFPVFISQRIVKIIRQQSHLLNIANNLHVEDHNVIYVDEHVDVFILVGFSKKNRIWTCRREGTSRKII